MPYLHLLHVVPYIHLLHLMPHLILQPPQPGLPKLLLMPRLFGAFPCLTDLGGEEGGGWFGGCLPLPDGPEGREGGEARLGDGDGKKVIERGVAGEP